MSETARDVYLPVAAQPSIDTFATFATRAERLGYDRVWCPETWGRDAVTILTAIAERTDSIGLGTSILNVYSRSPALLGQTAATLQEVSEGRFRMGLGPSGPILVEGWHGADFESPLRFTRETIEIVKTVAAGEPLEYDGKIHQLSGFRLRFDPPRSRAADRRRRDESEVGRTRGPLRRRLARSDAHARGAPRANRGLRTRWGPRRSRP